MELSGEHVGFTDERVNSTRSMECPPLSEGASAAGSPAPARVLPVDSVPYARHVGGYWTRSNDVEIDIVGAEETPVAKRLSFLGSIKWLEASRFDRRDLTALQNHRAAVTDQDVPLIAVSRSDFDCEGLDARFEPADLIEAWTV